MWLKFYLIYFEYKGNCAFERETSMFVQVLLALMCHPCLPYELHVWLTLMESFYSTLSMCCLHFGVSPWLVEEWFWNFPCLTIFFSTSTSLQDTCYFENLIRITPYLNREFLMTLFVVSYNILTTWKIDLVLDFGIYYLMMWSHFLDEDGS